MTPVDPHATQLAPPPLRSTSARDRRALCTERCRRGSSADRTATPVGHRSVARSPPGVHVMLALGTANDAVFAAADRGQQHSRVPQWTTNARVPFVVVFIIIVFFPFIPPPAFADRQRSRTASRTLAQYSLSDRPVSQSVCDRAC